MVNFRRFLLISGLLLAVSALGKADGKKKPSADEYSVVGGTVFRDNGLALAEADVTLELAGAPPANPRTKSKKLKTLSSPRGEFAFRVPPVAAKYKVAVSAKGFQPAEKVVDIQGPSERADATFSLSPESKH